MSGASNVVAKLLGIPTENVRVISYYLGGGFGCKGFTWPYTVLAAISARQVGRPVTLSLTREQMFTPMLYACPNVRTTHRLVRVNRGTPISMRAPGEAPGSFALECALDELAYALHMDPIELRLRNYAEEDPHKKRPCSKLVDASTMALQRSETHFEIDCKGA